MIRALTNRVFSLLLLLLIASGGAFGLAALLTPEQLASMAGFPGRDLFVHRVAGAASVAFAIGLLVAFRAPWAVVAISEVSPPAA